MINYINTLLVYLKKRKQLVEIRLEHEFFRAFFRDELQGNETELRDELSTIRAKKKQSDADTNRAVEIERMIGVLSGVKQRIRNAENIETELKEYIDVVKQKLCFWKSH
jgi:hypothetical protein